MTDKLTDSGHTVLAGFDGSEASRKALAWAATQAELTGATLKVMTSWEWPVSFGWAVQFPENFDPASIARQLLEEAAAQVRVEHPKLNVTPFVVEGHPALALVNASQDADVLVVGSRGHGEFAGMLIGSVSEHCATNAHCPVLVYREK